MSQQQKVVTTVDLAVAGVIAGDCVWLLGAMFSWSIWAYAGLAAFFFLISIGQLAVIRSKLRANKATIEMNERQKAANTETKPPPSPWLPKSGKQSISHHRKSGLNSASPPRHRRWP